MNADIRISTSLPRHPKYKRLKRLLSESPMEYLVSFWCYVASYAPTGELTGWNCDDIEEAAEWRGDKGLFFSSMIEVGFLSEKDQGYYPHDWEDHQPWVVGSEERSKAARKASQARWGNKPQSGIDAEAMRNACGTQCGTDATSNAELMPSRGDAPSPSPSPLPKTLKTEDEDRASVSERISMTEMQELYVTYLGKIAANQPVAAVLRDLSRDYPADRIREAFKRCAASAKKPNLSWVKTCLENFDRPDARSRDRPGARSERLRSDFAAIDRVAEAIHASQGV